MFCQNHGARVLLLSLWVVLIGGCASVPAERPASDLPADAKAFIKASGAAFRSQDIDKLAPFYHPDYRHDGHGRAAVLKIIEFELMPIESIIASVPIEGFWREGNLIYLHDSLVFANGSTIPMNRVMIKDDGRWYWYGNQKGQLRTSAKGEKRPEPKPYDFSAGHSRPVHFPISTSDGKRLELVGGLYLPEGKRPAPAVVILHGSLGLSGPRYARWAERLREWGYAALIIDMYGPRGLRSTFDNSSAPAFELAGDAIAAAHWLAAREDIDGRRIALLGFSHGGSTVLKALSAQFGERGLIRAGVAYYPLCPAPLTSRLAPTMVLIGAKDDWQSPKACRKMKESADPKGPPLDVVIYPGATHGFDAVGKDVVFHGHHVKYDKAVTDDAVGRVHRFLARYVR